MRTLAPLLCILLASSAGAQYEEQEQTLDHEQQDRRYNTRSAEASGKDGSLEDFLERADELVRDRNYRAASGDHYRVQSDDPRLDAKAALGLLEAFRAHFDSFWSDRLPLADYDGQSRVFLFYSFYKFNQSLAGDFRFNSIRPKGHYGSLFDVITLHTDTGCPEDLGSSLVHEAAHQLSDQRLFGAGNFQASPWLSEGLASYFGFTWQDKSGSFLAGEIGDKHPLLLEGSRNRGCSDIKAALRAARQAFKEAHREKQSLVEQLLSAGGSAAFYGSRIRTNYAISWILVHYLLHGDGGAHAESFSSYLELAGRGDAEPERLFELLGMTAVQLDAALELHLKRLKAH